MGAEDPEGQPATFTIALDVLITWFYHAQPRAAGVLRAQRLDIRLHVLTCCWISTARLAPEFWIVIGERQLGRRNLTDDQRSVIANDVREMRSRIALSEAGKLGGRGNKKPCGKSAHGFPPNRTSAAIAKAVKLPERKIRLAQEIKKAAPELVESARTHLVGDFCGAVSAGIVDDPRDLT
jgi:hypothetical protein